MKLICFSSNTAGGLLCNLLNNKFYPGIHLGYSLPSDEHDAMKMGLSSATIQKTVDIDEWNSRAQQLKDSDLWYGTHLHPSAIPRLDLFVKVLAITTTSRMSKLYRWLRYYHGWFKSVETSWEETEELVEIDKIRCLSKNVFEEFTPHPRCINVEFEDIVSGKFINENDLNIEYFNHWKSHNPWLYPIDAASWAVRRFDEAEYEITTNQSFKYI